MENLLITAQLIVALSVAFVWIFRHDHVETDFRQFGLSDLTRSIVGATKIALSTLLVAGIWYPSLVMVPAVMIGLFMLAAQYFHFTVKNSFIKHLPSLILLGLCAFIAFGSME